MGLLLLCLGCSEPQKIEPYVHTGICDASGVVAISEREFAVADDELNSLLIYPLETSGQESSSLELSSFLQLDKNPGQPPKAPKEADLEGAARIGDTIYWISSHGRNKKGKKAKGRMQFFATKIIDQGESRELVPYGQSYTQLLDDLIAAPQHQPFDLEQAATLPPKAQGGLNIEAVTNMPNGHLLIGFRSPTIQGKSLIVELTNPGEVIQGQKAVFGAPRLVDFAGGIRAMASEGEDYLVISNRSAGGQASLYHWDGGQGPGVRLDALNLSGFNPEAIAIFPDASGGRLLLLSDDGNREVEGFRCKDLQDRSKRQFRSLVVRYPGLDFYRAQ